VFRTASAYNSPKKVEASQLGDFRACLHSLRQELRGSLSPDNEFSMPRKVDPVGKARAGDSLSQRTDAHQRYIIPSAEVPLITPATIMGVLLRIHASSRTCSPNPTTAFSFSIAAGERRLSYL